MVETRDTHLTSLYRRELLVGTPRNSQPNPVNCTDSQIGLA